jgi:hypothetical protein
MWNLTSFNLETVLVSVQDRCTVCAERTISLEIVLEHSMVILGERLRWKLISVCLEIVLILWQYRCTVCAKPTIGSQIVLDAPDGSPT